MRTLVYAVRRIVLALPVLLGVVTITFLLFASLPVQDQLISQFGVPSPHLVCGYEPTCPCAQQDPRSVSGDHCTCLSPPGVLTSPQGYCQNPVYQDLRHNLSLDKPAYVQWGAYVYRSFTFQWGHVSNYSTVAQEFPVLKGVPVATALSWELPYTLELASLALLLIVPIGFQLGNASATGRNRPVDQFSRVLSFSGYALPAFLLGSLLICGLTLLLLPRTGYVVSPPWCRGGEALNDEFTYSWPHSFGCYPGLAFGQVWPSWMANGIQTRPTGFPTIDAARNGAYWLAVDSIVRMVLPAVVIAYGTMAGLIRFVRNSMLEVMNLDYIRTARAKGVPESGVMRRHAGRNSLTATMAVLGLTFAAFMGGFPVIESVFSLNGVGKILASAIDPPLDYAVILGCTFLFSTIVVSANIIVDILYAYLDPRVRLE